MISTKDDNLVKQQELVKLIATKHDLSESRAKQILTDTCNYILISLINSPNEVILPRLGTFKVDEDSELTFKPSHFASTFCTKFIDKSDTAEDLLKEIDSLVNDSYAEEDLGFTLSEEEEIVELEAKGLYPAESKSKSINQPDLVRSSFAKYLKEGFPHELSWTHPCSSRKLVFSHELIKSKLEAYKLLNRGNYRALWCLYTTGQSRAFIADHFNFSGSSIKRRWNRAIDCIMIMLMFPELEPEVPVNLYNSLI